MDNIILIGMPGSGKSSVGVVLAKTMGYDFLDGDLLIQSREGALLQDILNSRGVEGFLDLEGEVLSSIQCRKTVIAPGGSCVYRKAAMEHLQSLGTVVYLRLSYEQMVRRIHNLATRGIALQPGQTLRQVYDWRAPLYEAFAHITVDADGQNLYETLEAVRRVLAQKKAL